ncbi:MAG: panthothenate synthetase [Acidobacteriota bacterium]
MRMLVNVDFPVEPFNTYVKDGSIADRMHKVLGAIKPEAAYFSERNGHRGATLIVDVKAASDIPGLAEPFFLMFEADVEFRICMTPEDLGSANLGALGKQWA